MKMKLLATVLLSANLLCSCTSKDSAEKLLESQGFVDIEIGGYALFSCSDDDTFRTKFKAKTKEGEEVSGAVCKGIVKGQTIRYD